MKKLFIYLYIACWTLGQVYAELTNPAAKAVLEEFNINPARLHLLHKNQTYETEIYSLGSNQIFKIPAKKRDPKEAESYQILLNRLEDFNILCQEGKAKLFELSSTGISYDVIAVLPTFFAIVNSNTSQIERQGTTADIQKIIIDDITPSHKMIQVQPKVSGQVLYDILDQAKQEGNYVRVQKFEMIYAIILQKFVKLGFRHCDLHKNNIIINEETNTIYIIDWDGRRKHVNNEVIRHVREYFYDIPQWLNPQAYEIYEWLVKQGSQEPKVLNPKGLWNNWFQKTLITPFNIAPKTASGPEWKNILKYFAKSKIDTDYFNKLRSFINKHAEWIKVWTSNLQNQRRFSHTELISWPDDNQAPEDAASEINAILSQLIGCRLSTDLAENISIIRANLYQAIVQNCSEETVNLFEHLVLYLDNLYNNDDYNSDDQDLPLTQPEWWWELAPKALAVLHYLNITPEDLTLNNDEDE